VKLDPDTLSTVPAAPPSAGADRAGDPEAPGAAGAVVAEGGVVVAEAVVPHAAENPITTNISAATAIRLFFLFDNRRRTLGRRS
jgi:hypothetical protein